MPPKLRGKWALGITPRNFTWILKDKLAICERPGGVGDSHRRVRRQEEIIWIRENGFSYVISIIQAPHNLHNYDELGVVWRHRQRRIANLVAPAGQQVDQLGLALICRVHRLVESQRVEEPIAAVDLVERWVAPIGTPASEVRHSRAPST